MLPTESKGLVWETAHPNMEFFVLGGCYYGGSLGNFISKTYSSITFRLILD